MNHETQELVERVAELQQQKWSLEERVSDLGTLFKVTVNSLAINAQIMQNAWVFSIVPVQSKVLANNRTFTSSFARHTAKRTV